MQEQLSSVKGRPDFEYIHNRRQEQALKHEMEFVRRRLGGLSVVQIDNDPEQIYGRPCIQSSQQGKVWVLHKAS